MCEAIGFEAVLVQQVIGKRTGALHLNSDCRPLPPDPPGGYAENDTPAVWRCHN